MGLEDEEEPLLAEPQQWRFGGEANEFILAEEACLARRTYIRAPSVHQALKTQFGTQERNWAGDGDVCVICVERAARAAGVAGLSQEERAE